LVANVLSVTIIIIIIITPSEKLQPKLSHTKPFFHGDLKYVATGQA